MLFLAHVHVVYLIRCSLCRRIAHLFSSKHMTLIYVFMEISWIIICDGMPSETPWTLCWEYCNERSCFMCCCLLRIFWRQTPGKSDWSFRERWKVKKKKQREQWNRSGMTYFDRQHGTVNSEPHDGYDRMDMREVMKDLRLSTYDGMNSCIRIICKFQQCLGVVWIIFGASKTLWFGRC